MDQIEARLPGRLRHQGPVHVDPGLALGLLWIVAVLVVDNSSHAHVAAVPGALHSTAARWLVDLSAIAVAVAALALRHRRPLAALFAVAAAVVAAPAVLLLLGPALVALYTVAIALGPRDAAIAVVGVVAAFVLQRVAWGPTGDNSLPTVLIGAVASAGLGLSPGFAVRARASGPLSRGARRRSRPSAARLRSVSASPVSSTTLSHTP
jgi:hypothetical protein